jgi:tetratricopeptide (TPR) repeat protein
MTRTAPTPWRAALRSLTAALCLACAGAALASTACVRAGSERGAAVPMGSWPAWQDLSPLIDVASAHIDADALAIMREASALLREGKARSADSVLARAASSSARHWIAVARADVAALYFTTCIRGVAWRLPDDLGPHKRSVDYDPATKIAPGDLSVEALLTNLDEAIEAGKHSPALVTQARIARVRVTSYASSCPPNPEVQKRAAAVMNSDLATLAAERHLTPDLAYLWAGVQIQEYSGAAGRPFLMQALEGGFDDPSVAYMLAAIAFQQSELDDAEALAADAAARYEQLGDPGQRAQVAFLRGEIALAARAHDRAAQHYREALTLLPSHTGAILGLAEVERERSGPVVAVDLLHGLILELTLTDTTLDEHLAHDLVDDLESLVMMARADDLELTQITRDALLLDIDAEPDPFRRALRYFYAAALEIRLGEYDLARGHAATAAFEFDDGEFEIPAKANPREFLDRLNQASR